MKTDWQNIPAELRKRDEWVTWTRAADGKKVPDGSVTDPSTWRSFRAALKVLKRGESDGLGFVFTRESGLVAIDLDDCFGPTRWGYDVTRALNSYMEESPSGTGLHIIVKATLPPNVRHKVPYRGGAIEVYDRARYFTMTGTVCPGCGPKRIRRCPKALRRVLEAYGLLKTPASAPRVATKPRLRWLSDAKLLDYIRRFDSREYHAIFTKPKERDRSKLDLRAAYLFARYAGADPARIERLMEPLRRDKWDEARGETTWLGRTITKAITETNSFVIVRRKGVA